MRRIRLRTVLPVVLAFIGVALLGVCLAAARSSTESLLAKYKGATCLPLMVNSGISPPDTRAWNATVTTKNGSEVTVNAATMPGGIMDHDFPCLGSTLLPQTPVIMFTRTISVSTTRMIGFTSSPVDLRVEFGRVPCCSNMIFRNIARPPGAE